MSQALRLISSMATKKLLAELLAEYTAGTGEAVELESVGGVDAARRVQAGEAFDIVALGRGAMDTLAAGGHVVAGSVVDLVHSGVAVAVRAGSTRPDLDTEDAVRAAVLAARTIGYSTGPSGVQLARLFERWGIADEIRPRIVTPPPGIAVGSLIARGEVELGFQQLSEMLGVDGIDVVGPLPDAIQIITIFSAGIARTCQQPEAARALLAYLASPACDACKRAQGMEPTRG